MQTLIVPTHGRLNQLRHYFDWAFEEEEHQRSFIGELVELAASIPDKNIKNQQHMKLGLSVSCMELVQDLAQGGMLKQEDLVYVAGLAISFTSSLAYFLMNNDVVDDTTSVIFEGFTNMDMKITVLTGDEIVDERVGRWLKE